jgi:hypothetical protein
MLTPTVPEPPRQTESTSAGPLLDHRLGGQASAPLIRELDRRRNDGIDVRLLWNQTDDRVVVAVFDAKTSDVFKVDVASHNARDVFHHPYAYVPNDNRRPRNEPAV